MSSWATLLAFTGFKVDAPAATLSILPVVQQTHFQAPWAASTGWGALQLSNKTLTLTCRSGALAFQRLRLNLPGKRFQARLGKQQVRATATQAGGVTVLDFGKNVALQEGETLSIKAS